MNSVTTYPCLCLVFLLACSPRPCQADWLGFRGTNGNGVAEGAAPARCDANSIAWEADLPGRGVSSPIVVGDQVVVTASSGLNQDRLHVVSFDVRDGQVRWHRQFWATGRTLSHPTSANAAPTPASDGDDIVAFFSSNDVVCLGSEGQLKWFRGLASDYPSAGNDVGMASSPIVADGVVVCQVENQGDSVVEAIQLTDGTSLWRLDRPKAANWTSPVYLSPNSQGEREMVLLKHASSVSAHDLHTGDAIWEIETDADGIPSMVVTENRIYVPGSTFLALDRASDTVTEAWESNRLKPNPSPIATNDQRLIFINSAGVLNCHDARNADLIWQVRVGGKYWASPITTGEYIYTVNDAGDFTIVDRDGKKVDTHKFEGPVLGTPAISDGAIYVRSESKLWKVMQPQ